MVQVNRNVHKKYEKEQVQNTEDDDDVVWEIQVFGFCLIMEWEKNSWW